MEIKNSEDRPCYSNWQVMKSPEIVEIDDNSKCCRGSTDEVIADVFVAVGKNDMDVLKWALNHAVLPGNRILLVHVYSPVTYIPTPAGMLSIGQLSKGEMQIYINEENTKRRNLLQKYISLCTDAKVLVDTMLVESDTVAKTIVDLIPIVNITNLVMGTRRPITSTGCLFSSIFKTGLGKAAYVEKNAPRYCDISIVNYDKKVNIDVDKQVTVPVSSPPASSNQKKEVLNNLRLIFPSLYAFQESLIECVSTDI